MRKFRAKGLWSQLKKSIHWDSANNIESRNQLEAYRDSAPSIAVFRFDDLSEEGNLVYFCEGLAEEVLDTLRKVPNLRVASRMTAFQLNSQATDVREVGRKLKVQAELKGGVRKSGTKLHIAVELINTTDGTLLWSRKFDRSLKDIFRNTNQICIFSLF